MFSLTNVIPLFANKFARLSGRRFPLARILTRPFNCFLFWHIQVVRIREWRRMADVVAGIDDAGFRSVMLDRLG